MFDSYSRTYARRSTFGFAMKLMHCLSIAALALTACSARESANRAPRCNVPMDCAAGLTCYRGFCVADPLVVDDFDSVRPEQPEDSSEHPTVEPDAQIADTTRDASEPTMAPRADASAGVGGIEDTADASPPQGMAPSDAAVAPDAAVPRVDASTPIRDAGSAPRDPPAACNRDTLRRRADGYMAAMAADDPGTLRLHAAVRYTENGQETALGSGVWQNRPRAQFTRHVLDEARCGSVTVAVLQGAGARVVYGVRLRYLDDELLEVEAQVVPPNNAYYDPNSLIPNGPDPWVEPVAPALRMSREALTQLATSYFDAAGSPMAALPPHTPACGRRQNGALMDNQGSCGARPGNRPFAETRFAVIDETLGIATALVVYERYIGMYLFKAQGGTLENIDVIGGFAARTTGW